MILTSQNQTSSLVSCLRKDRLNYPPIMLYYLLISWRIRSSANFITLLLILPMSAKLSGNIYRGRDVDGLLMHKIHVCELLMYFILVWCWIWPDIHWASSYIMNQCQCFILILINVPVCMVNVYCTECLCIDKR